MKLRLSFFSALFISCFLQAQTTSDALRYSLDDLYGTARFRALSGAFGALGGDLSAVNINPAGSAVFTTNAAGFSVLNTNKAQDMDYFGGVTATSYNAFRLNQFGGVFVLENPDISSDWTKFSFGVVYDRTADYSNEWFSYGINPDTSVGSFFLNNAQGKRLDQISAFPDETISEAYAAIGNAYGYEYQQAFLGYESYIIDPLDDDPANTAYVLNVAGDSYAQQYLRSERGYNGKLAFNFATQFKDVLQLGLNLNSHFLAYDNVTRTDEQVNGSTSLVNDIQFQENLTTTGSGFSFQLGAIARVTPEFRLGFNFASPTWYYMSDQTSQFVSTLRIEDGESIPITINPFIVNYFPTYRLQTPWSVGASAAYIFGGRALLSFDYNYKDYSSMRYSPSDFFFSEQNSIISSTFKGANSYRFGGEYRFSQLSLRGGYRYEDSPYQDTSFFGDLQGYSFGLGYNFGMVKVDGSFNQAKRDYQHRLYNTGLTDTVILRSVLTDVVISMTFLF